MSGSLFHFGLILAPVLLMVKPATKCDFYFNKIPPYEEYNDTLTAYEYINSSKTCSNLAKDYETFKNCEETDLKVSLYADTIYPDSPTYLPFIRLNMSGEVYVPARELLFFYACMHAPGQDDNYCHDKEIQLRTYGELVVPCRGFQIRDNAVTSFRGDVNCFRLYGLSQYKIVVVLLPQKCKSELFVTMPLDYMYNPKIHHVFDLKDPQGLTYDHWSPFIFVDMLPDDGVWVRFERPVNAAKVLEVTINLYKREASTNLLKVEVVALPRTGFKFQNLEKGDYLIIAYVKRHHCQIHCVKENADTSCFVCPNTMLNFTLPEDKFTQAWRKLQPLMNAGKALIYILVALFCAVSVGVIGVLLYYRFIRPKILARQPATQFELRERPRVLILYTDDCHQHSQCVLQFAMFLKLNANAEVHMDQLDLVDHNIIPSIWLQQELERASYVLVVLSQGSQLVAEGRSMIQQRPYPNLFRSALYMITTSISRITNSLPSQEDGELQRPNNWLSRASTALNRYVVVRFRYSHATSIENIFILSRCKSFIVPADLNALVAHLHKVDTLATSLEFNAETQNLDNAVSAFEEFKRSNPGYLEQRLLGSDSSDQTLQTDNSFGVPLLPESCIQRTDAEVNELTEKMGLIVPSTHDSEDENYSNAAEGESSIATKTDNSTEEFPLLPTIQQRSEEND